MKAPAPPQGDFDLLVFVGRFQPFHIGHQAVIANALARTKRVLVLVGSANAARSARNPFSHEERRAMIKAVFPQPEVIVRTIGDHLYNDPAWIAEVHEAVARIERPTVPLNTHPKSGGYRVGIIGHAKDNSSYYLRIFPSYEAIDVPAVYAPANRELGEDEPTPLSSTRIRNLLFQNPDRRYDNPALEDNVHGEIAKQRERALELMPDAARPILVDLLSTAPVQAAIREHDFAISYRDRWAGTPFPPTFVTVDAVVQQAGHILMVIRKEQPGRGMLALPGGFLKQDETLLDGAVRELQEETQINVPPRVLLGAIKAQRTFDDPFRSVRGRTITTAFRFDLSEKQLPKVKGGDDAAAARWVPISQIRPETCFEDHAHIVRAMLGIG